MLSSFRLTPMWLQSVNIFLVIFIDLLVESRLVSLANAYNSIGLIKLKEKNVVDDTN